MEKRGTWGDHVTLQVINPFEHCFCASSLTVQQAAANIYDVEIHLLTSYKDTVWMEIKPQDGKNFTQKSLWLSFLAELHYNSLYTKQGRVFQYFELLQNIHLMSCECLCVSLTGS